MSHTIFLLVPDTNYAIAEYITELDYRNLILTSKTIRTSFLIQGIWEGYKRHMMPFVSHLSKIYTNNLNELSTYPTRTKFCKKINGPIQQDNGYGKVYDFCSLCWINKNTTNMHIKSIYGEITNYINEKTVISLKECAKDENREIETKVVNNNGHDLRKREHIIGENFVEFEIADGDHIGLDSSYSIAVLSYWHNYKLKCRYYKFIHIFCGNTPLNLSKYISIPTKLFSDFIDMTRIDKHKIAYSYPFLVFVNNKKFIVVDVSKNICPTSIRIYPVPMSDKKINGIYINLNRGHILSWILTDASWIKHIYSLDLTLGLNASPTHAFTAPRNNFVAGKFIHSSTNKRFCCTFNKKQNVWMLGDYSDVRQPFGSESKTPLTIKDLKEIPTQKKGSFELSWIAVNNYSYPIFLNITEKNSSKWSLEFCSDF